MPKRRVELSHDADRMAQKISLITGIGKPSAIVNAFLLRYGEHFLKDWGISENLQSFDRQSQPQPPSIQYIPQSQPQNSISTELSELMEPMEV
jgi:hypothetical protein